MCRSVPVGPYDVVVKSSRWLSHLLMSFLLVYASGQTDISTERHTDTLIAILRTPLGGRSKYTVIHKNVAVHL